MPWIALPARSPPSTMTSGRYTAAALTNFRKHFSEPCRSVAKYSRVDRATDLASRNLRTNATDQLNHLSSPARIDGIPGAAFDLEAGTDDHPIAIRQDFLNVGVVDPGIREQGHVGYGMSGFLKIGHFNTDAGRRAADQQRIVAEEGGAAGPLRNRAAGDGARELRRDVGEQCHILCADCLPVPGELARIGCDHAEVALEHPGEHLADEGRPGGAGNGDRCLRIPENVDPERLSDL